MVGQAEAISTPLDKAARDHAEAVHLLAGRTTFIEACRDWLKRYDSRLPEISLAGGRDEFLNQMTADGKSPQRIRQLNGVLSRLVADIPGNVSEVMPDILLRWLAGWGWRRRAARITGT